MPVVFYYIPFSHPCRAVEMTAEYLGIQLVKKRVDIKKGEQLKSEFLEVLLVDAEFGKKSKILSENYGQIRSSWQLNPQHCIPTIDDDGFILWESRAIMTYLVNKYAPDSPLYPRDPKARALVDKMLYFDIGTLHKAFREFHLPQTSEGKPRDPEKENNFKSVLSILEKILEQTTYAAGNNVTLADYSILANLVYVEVLLDFSYAEFPRISAWLRKLKKEAPKYKEINEVPLKQRKEVMLAKTRRS